MKIGEIYDKVLIIVIVIFLFFIVYGKVRTWMDKRAMGDEIINELN